MVSTGPNSCRRLSPRSSIFWHVTFPSFCVCLLRTDGFSHSKAKSEKYCIYCIVTFNKQLAFSSLFFFNVISPATRRYGPQHFQLIRSSIRCCQLFVRFECEQ